jgi:hypothetical protein
MIARSCGVAADGGRRDHEAAAAEAETLIDGKRKALRITMQASGRRVLEFRGPGALTAGAQTGLF